MVAGFLAVTLALLTRPVRELDLAVRDLFDAHRPRAADLVARGFNYFGQGGLLTAIAAVLAVVLAIRTRKYWSLILVAVAFLLTGVATTPLKLWFHRAAPHSVLPDGVEVRLFSQPGGLSYPSGHAVNTIVWWGVIALLAAALLPIGEQSRRWLRLGPPIVVGFTATYLGYHWLTDMVAGVFLGVLLDRLLTRGRRRWLTPG
jgi:membrane-associated phospholipid phosphatase